MIKCRLMDVFRDRTMHKIGFMLVMLMMSTLFTCTDAADTDTRTDKATVKDISRQAADTGRTIRDYTVEQRDDAVKSAKAALHEADQRLHQMERNIDRKWDQMDQAARKKARAALDALRKERNELAEWFGGLKHSSREAWDEVKGGFVKSYAALRQSFKRAKDNF